jgi:hypothetical protein
VRCVARALSRGWCVRAEGGGAEPGAGAVALRQNLLRGDADSCAHDSRTNRPEGLATRRAYGEDAGQLIEWMIAHRNPLCRDGGKAASRSGRPAPPRIRAHVSGLPGERTSAEVSNLVDKGCLCSAGLLA